MTLSISFFYVILNFKLGQRGVKNLYLASFRRYLFIIEKILLIYNYILLISNGLYEQYMDEICGIYASVFRHWNELGLIS